MATETTTRDIPSESTVTAIADLPVLDKDGGKVPFKSLYSPEGHRTLLIFIRHFYCGLCEDYVRALSKDLPPTLLSTTVPPTKLIIIGSGAPDLIQSYKDRTNCAFEIYTDPTRDISKKLDLQVNLKTGQKPQYLDGGVMWRSLVSTFNAVSSPMKALRAGRFDQNGGEFLVDEEGKWGWGHRMQTTMDHVEVEELKKVLGLEEGAEKKAEEGKDGE
jgi:hypothetical protein